MNADGTHQKRITALPSERDEGGGFSFSPDSRKIVFADTDTREIFVMNADGRNRRRLTPDIVSEAGLSSPCFSPDGRQIAFLNEGDILVMNATTGGSAPDLFAAGGIPVSVDWGPRPR
jgi:Tol biopolymer transport system component